MCQTFPPDPNTLDQRSSGFILLLIRNTLSKCSTLLPQVQFFKNFQKNKIIRDAYLIKCRFPDHAQPGYAELDFGNSNLKLAFALIYYSK